MWDLGRDEFDSFNGASILEIANRSFDESELRMVFRTNENNDNIEATSMEVGSN